MKNINLDDYSNVEKFDFFIHMIQNVEFINYVLELLQLYIHENYASFFNDLNIDRYFIKFKNDGIEWKFEGENIIRFTKYKKLK